ncbi:hypothetical protein BIW11_12805 [Tropilaelaps mercedesae]|uniref:C2H2-type domain-containing protein n=1 Tax=Tropilaelaps mercedesae TaxID=418985 RepID=A0A1V9X527_9ACAR|nr:hypothetical protein BIW11_12805 [Tropilaelaps mercedesae]
MLLGLSLRLPMVEVPRSSVAKGAAAEFMLFTEGILNGLHGTPFEEALEQETSGQSTQRRVTHKNIKYLLDGNHVCCLCGYKSVNSSNVVYHVRSRHTGHRPYGCPRCDFRSFRRGRVKEHMVRLHGLEESLCNSSVRVYPDP